MRDDRSDLSDPDNDEMDSEFGSDGGDLTDLINQDQMYEYQSGKKFNAGLPQGSNENDEVDSHHDEEAITREYLVMQREDCHDRMCEIRVNIASVTDEHHRILLVFVAELDQIMESGKKRQIALEEVYFYINLDSA